jgi:hypothetical protein
MRAALSAIGGKSVAPASKEACSPSRRSLLRWTISECARHESTHACSRWRCSSRRPVIPDRRKSSAATASWDWPSARLPTGARASPLLEYPLDVTGPRAREWIGGISRPHASRPDTRGSTNGRACPSAGAADRGRANAWGVSAHQDARPGMTLSTASTVPTGLTVSLFDEVRRPAIAGSECCLSRPATTWPC